MVLGGVVRVCSGRAYDPTVVHRNRVPIGKTPYTLSYLVGVSTDEFGSVREPDALHDVSRRPGEHGMVNTSGSSRGFAAGRLDPGDKRGLL